MEDQVGKLKAKGFAVERIHSGRARVDLRQACADYLNGKLQFLFIAPERLRVAGFADMLAKRPLSLIAIDEAHCISQWGHDFRPDYRMLGRQLPRFRPAPVIALTATATPVVQHDIAEQLGLVQPIHFVHGFRRANIAIEVVEIAPSQRARLTGELLQQSEHVTVLESIFTQLRADPKAKAELRPRRMDEEIFDKALEKLWTHGGVSVDYAENVSRGHDQWRETYVAQGEQKRAQIEQMIRYSESNQCRMAALVRHFGDLADGQKPCGICDFCAPEQCAAQRFRTATEAEHKVLLRVVTKLQSGGAKSTGKLYGELYRNREPRRI